MKASWIPLAAALVSLAGWPAAAAERTITKTEIRTAPPARTHQRLRDVVWDIVQAQDLRRKQRPVAQLTDLWLSTKVRGTRVAGLCRYDSVRIEFAPDAPGRGDADTPVHAVGLDTTHHFALLAPPRKAYVAAADDSRLPSDTDCSGVSSESERFFQAESEELAYEGYRSWMRLRNALQAKQPVPLECQLFPDEKQPCAEIILTPKPDDLQSIASCEAAEPGRACYLVMVDDRYIRILVPDAYATAPAADTILKVKLETPIILRHTRID